MLEYAGMLESLATLASAAVAAAGALWGGLQWWRKRAATSRRQLPKRRVLADYSAAELTKNGRILVIDDEDYAHYSTLRVRGFHVEHWRSISVADVEDLDLRYELVLLDIKGVVDDAGAMSGLEALRLLRRDNPWLPIVIFTSHIRTVRGQNADVAEQMADGVLKKAIPFDEFLNEVLEQIRGAFREEHFVRRLEGIGVKNAEQLVKRIQGEPIERVVLPPTGSATAEMQMQRVVEVLEGICNGQRWS